MPDGPSPADAHSMDTNDSHSEPLGDVDQGRCNGSGPLSGAGSVLSASTSAPANAHVAQAQLRTASGSERNPAGDPERDELAARSPTPNASVDETLWSFETSVHGGASGNASRKRARQDAGGSGAMVAAECRAKEVVKCRWLLAPALSKTKG